MLQFEDISEVTSWYKLLVRMQNDLLQSQQGHKQLTEQDKLLLEQYRAEKEAEMLQYKNELVQFKLCFDQAQSDIPVWVRSGGVGRGRSPSLALSRLTDVSSFSHGVMAESSNSLWDWRRFLIFSPSMGLQKEEWQTSLEYGSLCLQAGGSGAEASPLLGHVPMVPVSSPSRTLTGLTSRTRLLKKPGSCGPSRWPSTTFSSPPTRGCKQSGIC